MCSPTQGTSLSHSLWGLQLLQRGSCSSLRQQCGLGWGKWEMIPAPLPDWVNGGCTMHSSPALAQGWQCWGLEGFNGSQGSLYSQPFVKVDKWHFVPVLGHDAVPQLRLKVSQCKRAVGRGDRH